MIIAQSIIFYLKMGLTALRFLRPLLNESVAKSLPTALPPPVRVPMRKFCIFWRAVTAVSRGRSATAIASAAASAAIVD